MFYHLPPVGNPVFLHPLGTVQSDSVTTAFLSSDRTRFYNSGTAALAAAIIAAMKVKVTESAEVIIPAYGCPDLVSAVEFSGARPVLVDISAGLPWLDIEKLESGITNNTIAIVAVNLFGISERWSQLRRIADNNDIVLIEDSAQYFPVGEELQDRQGDFVIFSFGRGKPVSLLGGGAVLASSSAYHELLPQPKTSDTTYRQRFTFNLRAKLYNAMISPFLYWFPKSLPFLYLGETRYHKLPAVESMDQIRMELLPGNVSYFQSNLDVSIRCKKISQMLGSLVESQDNLRDLSRICHVKDGRRLLRYPLLLEAGLRDYTYQKLNKAGLGVSTMYPTSLPKITGLICLLDDKHSFPNAEDFASRILTLPTHAGVTDKDIKKMKTILSKLG